MNARKPHPSTAATHRFARKQIAMPKGNESSGSKDRKKIGTSGEEPKTPHPTHEHQKSNPNRSQRPATQRARDVELDPERQPIAKDSMREVQQMILNPRRRAGTSGALSAHTHTGMQKTHPNPTHMIGLLCNRRVAA